MPEWKEHRMPIVITALFIVIAISSQFLLKVLPKNEGAMAEMMQASISLAQQMKELGQTITVTPLP